jgi:hypothetical protein
MSETAPTQDEKRDAVLDTEKIAVEPVVVDAEDGGLEKVSSDDATLSYGLDAAYTEKARLVADALEFIGTL